MSAARCRLAYGTADATAIHCFSKIQIDFTFLVPAHLGSHGKKTLNGGVCVFSLEILTSCGIKCTNFSENQRTIVCQEYG